MLVFNRAIGEVVYIGDDITVTVVAVKNGFVKLGFTSKVRELPIHRKEIYERIQQERKAKGEAE
jgi:carbon storage regulator